MSDLSRGDASPSPPASENRRRLRVIHMGFKDHGWTRVVLQTLLKDSFTASSLVLVVEEDSEMAKKKGPWYCDQLAETAPVPPTCEEQVAAFNERRRQHREEKDALQYACVPNHNEAADLLQSFAPDILIFGTTRIIAPQILSIPTLGCLNCHPSMPGGYRGALPYIREILQDIPIGVMCHWATEQLDLGDVLSAEHVQIRRGDSLSHVIWKVLESAGRQAVTALDNISRGRVTGTPQTYNGAPALKWAEDDVIEAARQKLIRGEYKCYAEEQM